MVRALRTGVWMNQFAAVAPFLLQRSVVCFIGVQPPSAKSWSCARSGCVSARRAGVRFGERESRVAMLRHAWRRSHRRGTRRCWAWPLPPRPPRPRRSPARVRAAARPCCVLCAACCVRSRALLSSTLGTNRRSSLHFSLFTFPLQVNLHCSWPGFLHRGRLRER
jgi:hypothetical protein